MQDVMTREGNGQRTAAAANYGTGNGSKLAPEPSDGFVLTAHVEELVERALCYLGAGYPINLAGPAGTGKTTLALHLAAELGRPVTLIQGDDEFATSDLVGSNQGYRKSRLVDNFIHSVHKTEETMKTLWVENQLTTACKHGHTLIYDEFTRSRPEANNAFLSVLSEGLLNLPTLSDGGGHLEIHPEFRCIFTANPQEYAGVHKSQDALMDRLITIYMDHYDAETEVAITAAKSGISTVDAERIVGVVRYFDQVENGHQPSIRPAIMIARVLVHCGATTHVDDVVFQRTCHDVLNLIGDDSRTRIAADSVKEAIQQVCGDCSRLDQGSQSATPHLSAGAPSVQAREAIS